MAAEWVALAVFVLGASLALASAPLALAESAGDAPRARLQRAFERTFQQPGVRRVELRVLRAGRVVAERAFELAHRPEGRGARSLLRFVAPEYLRGHALLIVDTGSGGPADTWLYQPEERRPRRVAATQKGDSFYGSDLSFEDLERPDWGRWRAEAVAEQEEAGVRCRVVDAWPPPDSQYGRLRVWIAAEREAVARIDFFPRAGARPERGVGPLKRLRVELEAAAAEEHGFLRVSRIGVDAIGRPARTELSVERMAIDPALPASLFSATRLEREGEGLFELAERHARESSR